VHWHVTGLKVEGKSEWVSLLALDWVGTALPDAAAVAAMAPANFNFFFWSWPSGDSIWSQRQWEAIPQAERNLFNVTGVQELFLNDGLDDLTLLGTAAPELKIHAEADGSWLTLLVNDPVIARSGLKALGNLHGQGRAGRVETWSRRERDDGQKGQ